MHAPAHPCTLEATFNASAATTTPALRRSAAHSYSSLPVSSSHRYSPISAHLRAAPSTRRSAPPYMRPCAAPRYFPHLHAPPRPSACPALPPTQSSVPLIPSAPYPPSLLVQLILSSLFSRLLPSSQHVHSPTPLAASSRRTVYDPLCTSAPLIPPICALLRITVTRFASANAPCVPPSVSHRCIHSYCTYQG